MQDFDADPDHQDQVPARRAPRRIARLLALDDAIETCMMERLDRIDRKAPLPADTIAAVNRLLEWAAPTMARLPAADKAAPFPAGPVQPADAFIALYKVRAAICNVFTAQLATFASAMPEPDPLPALPGPLAEPLSPLFGLPSRSGAG